MRGKRVVLSAHARWRAERRGIEETMVLEVAANPEQILPIRTCREIRQSRRNDPIHGRQFLIRVVVETETEADTVVTVYRSSKVDKYWRNP